MPQRPLFGRLLKKEQVKKWRTPNFFLETPEKEAFASDEYLKKFFKENYDIEFPEDDELESLSDDDKQTLKELKEYLIKEAQKDGKILRNGVFKTMEEFSS